MPVRNIINLRLLLYLILLLSASMAYSSNKDHGYLKGRVEVSESWDSVIYLSHVPSFEQMYSMSHKMIISRSVIDSLGNFEFDLGFLPKGTNLFRLHISKKEDSPNSIIIGGKDENHLFFVANRSSIIELSANSIQPPFRNVTFLKSEANISFQNITDMVFVADSIAAESSSAKRKFIEQKVNEELLIIADTTSEAMVSLYAIYLSDLERDLDQHTIFLKSYLNKWQNEKSAYFTILRDKLPDTAQDNHFWLIGLLVVSALAIGFALGKVRFKNKDTVKKLSV